MGKHMNLSDHSDQYLIKTYCFLEQKMLPQNAENMQNFPPSEMWHGVKSELIKAMEIIKEELQKRKIDIGSCNCESMRF